MPDPLTNEQLLNLFADSMFEAHGLRPDRRIRPATVPFNYTLGANATISPNFNIGGSSPFIVTEVRGWFTGLATVNLRPSTYDEGLSTGGMHSTALFGPPAAPRAFVLPRPWLLDPRTVMTVDLADQSTSSNPLGIVLVGFRSSV